MRYRSIGVLVGALAIAACSSSASTSSTDPPLPVSQPQPTTGGGSTAASPVSPSIDGVHTFTAKDGTTIEYVLVVPPARSPGTAGKVLIAFPPGGQELDLTKRLVDTRWRDEAVSRGWVVASPSAPATGLFFTDGSAALVPEFLDSIAADYPPEGGRFDLGGVSNGGLSAFRAALEHPERFRSLVVFPGYSPEGADDPRLSTLKEVGVSMWVGGDDSGWLEASRTTAKHLQDAGGTVELHVVEGQGHIIETLTGKDLYEALERVRG